MAQCKTPDYVSGRRGRHWTHALRAAQKAGAVIVTATGDPVRYAARSSGPGRFRPWIAEDGMRYDSYDLHPEW